MKDEKWVKMKKVMQRMKELEQREKEPVTRAAKPCFTMTGLNKIMKSLPSTSR